ncbi:MAG: GTP-binding protein [Archangiaceae bacterium]|nr:GTP-binding protein [Archangiaceae bacterium]
MSTVNVMAREIAAKVVFYGPGLSGKTTTLKKIYDSVKPAHRGELMSLPTEADRTLFFDFLPVKVERVGEYSVRLALYTVPGQVFYNATRKLVLQGADGVVFVADSQEAAEDSNRESMVNLEENLAEQGIRIEKFPLVIQYNKRDLPGATPVDRLRTLLNARGVPEFETCATSGQGVLDTLKAVMRLVIRDLRQKRVVPPVRGAEEQTPDLEGQLRQHLPASERAAQVPPPPGRGAAAAPPMATPARGVAALKTGPGLPQATAPRPPAVDEPPKRVMGAAAALAPGALIDQARVADSAFAAGDYDACVRTCQEAVRRALAYAGARNDAGSQGLLLRVDGPDLLRLELLSTHSHHRIDDAAFALYVLMQTFIRLTAAGLPPQAD